MCVGEPNNDHLINKDSKFETAELIGSNNQARHTQPRHVLDIMTLYIIKKYYCNNFFVGKIPLRLSPRGILRSHCVDLIK